MKQTSAQEKLEAIHRRKLAVLCGFGALLLLLVIVRLRGGPAPASAALESASKEQAAEPAPAPLATAIEPAPWPSELGRDPFERETVERGTIAASIDSQSVDSLQLKSILFSKVSRVMINNRVLVEGDTIDGFLIRRINRRSVIVERDGASAQLDL